AELGRLLASRATAHCAQKSGLDRELRQRKVAVGAHPPVRGGKVKSFDDKEARGVEGVREVFEIPVARGGTGVAVVSDKFWPAKQGRDRLKIEWDTSGVERAHSSQLWTKYKELARTTGNVAVARGDARAIAGAAG